MGRFDPTIPVCYGFELKKNSSGGGGTIPLANFLLAAGRLGELLLQTGWVSRSVLLILLGFSLFSWAIIFQKYRLFSRINSDTRQFLSAFRSASAYGDPKAFYSTAPASPLVPVYAAGYRELALQVSGGNPHGGKVKSMNAITAKMQLASAEEVHKLEHLMTWLATTGTVTPFIGLFGTVWGVMDAFAGLGTAGSASLPAVAPGIAEALIATAAGLFAAIPAVIAYNYFLSRIKQTATRMDNFAMEFAAEIEKQYSV
jgi:biopolymer transport protein TolQ